MGEKEEEAKEPVVFFSNIYQSRSFK